MYAVIFKATLTTVDEEYTRLAQRMRERALEEYGWNAPEYLPLAGSKTQLDEVSKLLLEKDNISKVDFKKARMKGTFRRSFLVPKWHWCKNENRDLIISFSLRKGGYATVLLEELMKSGNVVKTNI